MTMTVSYESITQDNLGKLAKAGDKWGMPRSPGWLRRTMFDPTVNDLVNDKVRGHMAVTEDGEVVAVQGYYYQPLYFRQEKMLGDTGCIMGADHKYGEELLCVLDRNRETRVKTGFGFGNDFANKRSATIGKRFSRLVEPPGGSGYFYAAAADVAVYPMALWHRCFVESDALRNAFDSVSRLLTRPIQWFVDFGRRVRSLVSGYEVEWVEDIDENEFGDFWERFLAKNSGLTSSREPERLKWLFLDSIKAGMAFMGVAKREGRIDGYVILRRELEAPIPTFVICDICAVGNDVECLKALIRAACAKVRWMNGFKIDLFCYMKNTREWFPAVKRIVDHPTFLYRAPSEVDESLQRGEGWFFGPLDGERCMGYGGYVDL